MLQAAGLRLLCHLWHTSGGRAYPQLRAAVIGEGQLCLDYSCCLNVHATIWSGPHNVLALSMVHDYCVRLAAPSAGYAAPGQSPGLALRVARAECLRDICSTDPDKAVELVGLVQVRGWLLLCSKIWTRNAPGGLVLGYSTHGAHSQRCQ